MLSWDGSTVILITARTLSVSTPSLFILLLAVFIVVLVGPSASKKDRPRFPPVCQSLCWPGFDLVTPIVTVVGQTAHLFVLNKYS